MQYGAGMPGRNVPVIGLMEMKVQTNNSTGLAIPSIGLDHLTTEVEPLAPIRFNERTPLVGEDLWMYLDHTSNYFRINKFSHEPSAFYVEPLSDYGSTIQIRKPSQRATAPQVLERWHLK